MDIADLLIRANEIKNESNVAANTADRIGGLLADTLSEIHPEWIYCGRLGTATPTVDESFDISFDRAPISQGDISLAEDDIAIIIAKDGYYDIDWRMMVTCTSLSNFAVYLMVSTDNGANYSCAPYSMHLTKINGYLELSGKYRVLLNDGDRIKLVCGTDTAGGSLMLYTYNMQLDGGWIGDSMLTANILITKIGGI